MKILQVCPKYFPSFGGVEQHVKNISERLARKYEVTVFTTDSSGKLPREEEINGVLVKRFRSLSPNNAYHFPFGMLKELRSSKFDIVHGHAYHAFPLLFSRYAKKEKFVITPHYHRYGHTPLRNFLIKFYKPFGRKIFQEANRIIAVSSYEKRLLLRDFRINSNKVSMIPNGVDWGEFCKLEKKVKEYKTILYIGRLERYKGIQYVIQSLSLLDENIHLDIVGKGPYKRKLVALTNDLRLSNRVNFYQDLTREELLRMYAKADIFVLLSKYEAFAITIAEALASKIPCLVANTSALKEWVDNKNCFGINYPINCAQLARLINEIIGKKVGKVKLWDWEQVVTELIRIYEE